MYKVFSSVRHRKAIWHLVNNSSIVFPIYLYAVATQSSPLQNFYMFYLSSSYNYWNAIRSVNVFFALWRILANCERAVYWVKKPIASALIRIGSMDWWTHVWVVGTYSTHDSYGTLSRWLQAPAGLAKRWSISSVWWTHAPFVKKVSECIF